MNEFFYDLLKSQLGSWAYLRLFVENMRSHTFRGSRAARVNVEPAWSPGLELQPEQGVSAKWLPKVSGQPSRIRWKLLTSAALPCRQGRVTGVTVIGTKEFPSSKCTFADTAYRA